MIAIPFIYFSILAIIFYYRSGWNLDVAATLLLVTISFFAILIDVNDIYGEYGINLAGYTLPTILLFCLQWTLVLIPLSFLANLPLQNHAPLKTPLLYALCLVMILSSVALIVSSLDDIREALIMDMVDVYGQHGKDLAAGARGETNYLLLIPQILVSTPFPTLALFLWFYMKAFMKTSFILRFGMIISSIVQAILAIVIAGRSAIVFWLFDFFLLYAYFYRYLNRRTKIAITATAGAVATLIGALFLTITISRFDDSRRNTEAFESIYGYAGQHVNNFCTMFVEGDDSPFQTARIFPLYSKIVKHQQFDLVDHYEEIAKHVNALVNVFDTFGGEIYLDLGWFGYLFFFLILITLTYIIRYRWTDMPFNNTFALVIAVAFFTRGLFAWPFTGHYTTMALMLMPVLCYMFRYAFRI